MSLRGTVPPVWRRLEVPSAITLDRLHQILQEAFGWSGIGRHWFQTACGDFDGSPRPDVRPEDRGDDDTITLARAAGRRDWIGYRYGYRDEWQADIVVEEILPATPGEEFWWHETSGDVRRLESLRWPSGIEEATFRERKQGQQGAAPGHQRQPAAACRPAG